jgi:hypothetical protein
VNAADIARFWSHVDVKGADDCWEWKRARSAGYGRFAADGRMLVASRIAFVITHGELGTDEARHTCDNPPCCNPAHLIRGTHAENMADMARRERSPRRRLTGGQVLDIRSRAAVGARVTDLAAEYGVTPSNISQIVSGRIWKHIGAAA